MQFVILAQPRTGTHFFRSLLNLNPEIFVYGEVLYPHDFFWGFQRFLKHKRLSETNSLISEAYLEEFFKELSEFMCANGKSHVGFDLKIPQLSSMPKGFEVVRGLGYITLHLKRIHKPAAIFSQERAVISSRQGFRVHGPTPHPVHDISVAEEWLRSRISEYEYGDALAENFFKGDDYVEIFYEDLLTDAGRNKTEATLQKALGGPVSLAGQSHLTKHGPKDLTKQLICDDRVLEIIQDFDRRVLAHQAFLSKNSAGNVDSPDPV